MPVTFPFLALWSSMMRPRPAIDLPTCCQTYCFQVAVKVAMPGWIWERWLNFFPLSVWNVFRNSRIICTIWTTDKQQRPADSIFLQCHKPIATATTIQRLRAEYCTPNVCSYWYISLDNSDKLFFSAQTGELKPRWNSCSKGHVEPILY